MEEWRDVPGYEGLYQISIDTPEGRCRSLNYHRTGKVKEHTNIPSKKDGRIFWTLSKNGKKVQFQAARWIALTYPELIENEYFEGAVIDHINTDRLDNRPSNLRWVTQKGNVNNPITKEKMRKAQIGKHPTEETRRRLSESHKGPAPYRLNHPNISEQVEQYTKEGVYIDSYPSCKEAERQTKVPNSNISACCRGKRQSAGEFIWRYAEQV